MMNSISEIPNMSKTANLFRYWFEPECDFETSFVFEIKNKTPFFCFLMPTFCVVHWFYSKYLIVLRIGRYFCYIVE